MQEKEKKKKTKGSFSKAAPKQEETRGFLYLLPEAADVHRLAEALDFVEEEAVEIWNDINLMELALKSGGTLTFEDIMSNLREADRVLLDGFKAKQVYACDYAARDREAVGRIMEALLQRLGGFLASDTEDFRPLLQIGEL